MNINSFAADIQRTMQGFQAIADSVSRTARKVQQATAGMQAVLRSAESLTRIPEMLRRQNEAFAYLMPRLADKGWYFGMEMTLPAMMQLYRLARDEDFEAIDQALADWYRRQGSDTIHRISERFPDRAPILQAAFTAHEAGNYVLAIPAFLAQADGIAHHYLTESFFCTRRWRARLREFMEENSLTDFSTVMAIPLDDPGVLRRPTWELEGQDDILNRHQVLHGLRCDYGSEVNSLKCIGLLDYIQSAGEMILTREPEQSLGGDSENRAEDSSISEAPQA